MSNMDKIRIAYLMHGVFYGGGTRSLYLLLKSIKNEVYDKSIFTISCHSEKIKNDFERYVNHFEIFPLDTIGYNQVSESSYLHFKLSANKSNRKFVDKLKQMKIDILHVNSSVFPQVLKSVKENSNIKIVTHVREWLTFKEGGKLQKYMIDQIYRYSDAIIAISENEATPFIHHPNIHILPNPFDFAGIQKVNGNFREVNSIQKKTIVVGMLAHFNRYKGHIDFIKALKYLLENQSSKYFFLFIVVGVKAKTPLWKRFVKKLLGKKDYHAEVLNYIKKYKLENHVKLIPYTHKIFEVLKEIDIVVRPAITGDPWGRDIIEAMAMGKPIVATGNSEFFVRNGENGYLVPPNQADKMAEKILDLINDPEKRILFGQKGFQKARKLCDIEEYGKKIDRIYQSLVG